MTVVADRLPDPPRAMGAPTLRFAPTAAMRGGAGPRPGDLVAGKYLVETMIGEGGMGVVVAARHLELGHRVAIKYLGEEARGRADMVEQFRWEAHASLQIRSEHVVRIFDAGTLENGAPYMVMELLEGCDLGALMKARTRPLPVDAAVDVILQACEALAEAHALGIVHRDLKPQNLFVTSRADGTPLVKVIDFGVSSHRGPTDRSRPPVERRLVGSPAYMSPEQARNAADVDARADVWSLGVVLYELLTGSLIYEETKVGAMLVRICTEPAAPPRSRRADLPPRLDAVIMACLEKDRDRRVQSVAELALRLLPFASERSRLSVERTVQVAKAWGDDALRRVARQPRPPSAPRAGGLWVSACPLVVALGAALTMGLLGNLPCAGVRGDDDVVGRLFGRYAINHPASAAPVNGI